MKTRFYFLTLLLLGFGVVLQAQTYQVTLEVDMSNEAAIADTVSLAGNIQTAAGYPNDWTPGETMLTDGNNDSVYDITLTLAAGTYEFKYINGTQWGQDEGVPGACATNGNRSVIVAGDMSVPVHCFASCTPCVTTVDTINVTLQVDMHYLTIEDTVSIAGDIQGAAGGSSWTPGATILTDLNNDSIYDITLRVPVGTYSYKFINGTSWGQDESVPGACAVNNNREIVLSGTNDTTIAAVCFATCAGQCTAPLPAINVTFQVDMSNEIVSANGLFVAGSFQNPAWVKDTIQLSDANNDLVFTWTESIVPAEYQYKYYNGNNGDPDGETHNFEMDSCGASNGIGGYNRLLDITGQLTDTILPIFEFNSCNTLAAALDDSMDDLNLTIYPNPFDGTATIEFYNPGELNLQLTTITGQVVRTMNNIQDNVVSLDKGNLTPGLYFLSLSNEKGSKVTKKIIVR